MPVAELQPANGVPARCRVLGARPSQGQACIVTGRTRAATRAAGYRPPRPADGYTCVPTNGNVPGGPAGGPAQFTLKIWDQCGGMGGNCQSYQCLDGAYPNYACPDGNSCQRQNQWYHQCLPGSGGSGGGGGGSWSGGGGGSSWSGGGGGGGGSGSTLNLWDQCGGKGGNCGSFTCVDGVFPGQSCPAGSTCQRLHEWFSQCRPGGTSYGTCDQVRAHRRPGCVPRLASRDGAPSTQYAAPPHTPPHPPPTQVPLWASCGGLSSKSGANATDGSVCCPAGTTCNYYNIWQATPARLAGVRHSQPGRCHQAGRPLTCPHLPRAGSGSASRPATPLPPRPPARPPPSRSPRTCRAWRPRTWTATRWLRACR
jgi:hypothetical protein